MATRKIIRDFFEEQFQNTSSFFLYEDKQLLRDGRYREFAEGQIKKAGTIFWSVSFTVFICSWYGIKSLIEYGSGPNWFDLIFGLSCWLGLIVFLVLAAKKYYTIKSSMSLFIKLLNDEEEPGPAS